MTIFRSSQPDIDLPSNITIWDWIFDSPASPLSNHREKELAGYVNAKTRERLSWKQVKEASTHISTALVKQHGFQTGDTLALFSQNSIWYPVAMFGAIRTGGMISGASPAYSVEEMTYALKVGNAKYLATSSTVISIAEKAAAAAGIPRSRVFLLEGSLPGYTTIIDLIKQGESFGPREQVKAFKIPKGKTNREVCGFLSFSSGTTGLPKAVQIAHGNVIAQALQILPITPSTHRKVLAVLPLFHITGLVHILHVPLLLNAEVIMLPAFSVPDMLGTIVEYQIEEVLLVPPILIRLVRDPVVDKYDLRCIKRFSSGAAPLSDEILQQLAKKFPNTGFKQGYGMTESCSCITAHPPTHYDYKYAHAVGTVCASTEVRLLKEDGTDGNVGESGEVLARGPQIVMGYLNNEKATRETFDSDGWLHTGDVGLIDEDGMLHIVDRIKEMVKVKGIGVAPAELEDLLLGHELVEDVGVMGVPDDYSGELPKAFIVLKPKVAQRGRDLQQVGRELIGYVKERKVRHKWVREVEFVEEIPKSASGKILRRVLKKQKEDGKVGVVVKEERARL